MQAGSFDGGDVISLSSYVLVDGVVRPHAAWNVSRDLTGDLPDTVLGFTGIAQATGKVQWSRSEDVSAGAENPWNASMGWTPRRGARVEIYDTDGVTTWPRFKGVIDRTQGSVTQGMSSTVVDDFDRRRNRVRVPTLLRRMPPVTGTELREIALSSVFHVATALRAGKWDPVPPARGAVRVDAVMMGSVWPSTGTLAASGPFDAGMSEGPLSTASPWGRCMYNVAAQYTPQGTTLGNAPVQITMMVAPAHAGVAYVAAQYGTDSLRLEITAARVAIARVNGTNVGSITLGAATLVSLRLAAGSLTLSDDAGHSTMAAPAWAVTTAMTGVAVSADWDARIGGVQVSGNAAAFNPVTWAPTARIRIGNLTGAADATPAVDGAAGDLLDEVSSCTLSAQWIDEAGTYQYAGSDVLRTQAPVQTVTTLDDVLSLDWEDSLLNVRSEVNVKYMRPVITRRNDYSVEVWASSTSDVLQNGESQEILIEPGSDEEWVMVDENPIHVGAPGWNSAAVNAGVRSIVGGTLTNGITEYYARSADRDTLTTTLTKLSESKYVLEAAAHDVAAGWQVELRLLSEAFTGATALWPYWWGKESTRIRAKGRFQKVDLELAPITAGSTGQPLDFDAGIWSSVRYSTATQETLGTYLAGQVANPEPVITGLSVTYDPRRQLGDVYTINSELMGVSLRVLVCGVESSGAPGNYTQSLTVRVISATTSYLSYEGFADAFPDTLSYEQWRALRLPGDSYTDFNNNPLRGA